MNLNRKTSVIWTTCNVEKFRKIINDSKTFRDVLSYFGLTNKGNNYRTLRQRCEYEGVSYDHLYENIYMKKEFGKKIPMDRVLVENSTYSRSNLKKRLLENKLLENKCSTCALPPNWNGFNLVMVLDHINGVSDDNRLNNLRFLCPNCNSQTKTFAGRNANHRVDPNKICKCGNKKWVRAKHCQNCSAQVRRKVHHPSKKQLERDIANCTWTAIGKKYGVSDNAARKWARKYGLII